MSLSQVVKSTKTDIKYTHVVWDFNGTLIDDVQIGIDCINALLIKRGLPIIPSKEDYAKHFRFPIKEYYIELGFDFEKEDYDKVALEWAEIYNKKIKSANLREGVLCALEKIRDAKISQSVLSASEQSSLISLIDSLGISDFFDEIIGLEDYRAFGKTQAADEWKKRVKPKKAVMIGDTDHDFCAAEALGADCILLSGGHQCADRLRKCGCTAVNNCFELLKILGIE